VLPPEIGDSMINLFVSYIAIAETRQLWGNEVMIVDHAPATKADIDELQAIQKFTIESIVDIKIDNLVIQNWKVM